MPTSEINRLIKSVEKIAKENGQYYCCAEIRKTFDGNSYKKEYTAYINDLISWLESDSFNGLIELIKNHIDNKKLSIKSDTINLDEIF